MIKSGVLCGLLCLSLVAVEIGSDQLARLRVSYRGFAHVFMGYASHRATLEIKYVCQDQKVCGACWDIFKLPEEEQHVWGIVGSEVTKAIMLEQHANECGMAQTFQEMYRLFLEKHGALRPLDGCEALKMQHMQEIINPPRVNPWVLMLTSEALGARVPGTVSITAAGFACCLVRVPRLLLPGEDTAKELKALREQNQSMQKMLNELIDYVRTTVRDLSQRVLEASQEIKDLGQRVTALERKEMFNDK